MWGNIKRGGFLFLNFNKDNDRRVGKAVVVNFCNDFEAGAYSLVGLAPACNRVSQL